MNLTQIDQQESSGLTALLVRTLQRQTHIQSLGFGRPSFKKDAGSLRRWRKGAGSLRRWRKDAGSLRKWRKGVGSLRRWRKDAGSLRRWRKDAGSLRRWRKDTGSLRRKRKDAGNRGLECEADLHTDTHIYIQAPK